MKDLHKMSLKELEREEKRVRRELSLVKAKIEAARWIAEDYKNSGGRGLAALVAANIAAAKEGAR